MVDRINWSENGFNVYGEDLNSGWHDVPGVYIFAGQYESGNWYAIYIGSTNSFQDRLPYHERWDEARRRGATHIHVRQVDNERDRLALERELIRDFQPALNSTYR